MYAFVQHLLQSAREMHKRGILIDSIPSLVPSRTAALSEAELRSGEAIFQVLGQGGHGESCAEELALAVLAQAHGGDLEGILGRVQADSRGLVALQEWVRFLGEEKKAKGRKVGPWPGHVQRSSPELACWHVQA